MTGMYVASNPMALSAQFGLVRNMGALGETLTRLSTGLKINSGKDDPAGLIASELLKAQITGTMKAITNTQRANALIATADSSLGQVGNLLNDIKGLVVEAAQTGTMTAEQIAANQLQVDSALDSIDRIARTTNYGGKKLLDGSLDFRTAGMSGGLGNVKINSANFGTASAIGVNVNVTQAADYARLISNGTGVGVDTTFDVIGNRGSATINVGAGTTNSEIAAAINRSTDSTGVLAYVEGLAQRGSVVLSSAGANNDIVVTALEKGFDAGNYSFRITRGHENDARVVQEAVNGRAGVIEISLKEAYERRYNNFAGLFDITVDTTNRDNPDTDATSITMTRGNANSVIYNSSDKSAFTNVINGKSMTATVAGPDDAVLNSLLNGWTIVVDDRLVDAAGNSFSDLNTKTLYVASTIADAEDVAEALAEALAKSLPDAHEDPVTVTLTGIGIDWGTNLVHGDRFTFSGGAAEGEVFITYKEGATANDILAMLNKAPNVSASLASGVKGDALIPMLPTGQTYMHSGGTDNSVSRYSSGATSQEVIDLINSKLGHLFEATALSSEGGSGGRVSFMDAAVDYGDVNLGNALRFTGMDNGPIVRLTNLGTNGQPIANQKLGINVIHPSDADIKAGIHTPVLEIRLATDAQGNSITSARDIVEFFKTLTPEQTMGVSVSQLLAPGVDPNGRIFATGECGKDVVIDTCPTPIDGIVQPTGAPGTCGPQQGDLLLLGTNQRVVADFAVARIDGNTGPIDAEDAISEAVAPTGGGAAGSLFLEFEGTSAMNGITFGFTRDEAKEGFDSATGKLIVFLGPEFGALDGDDLVGNSDNADDAALKIAIDGAIAANWEAIRAYTKATGDAVKVAAFDEGTTFDVGATDGLEMALADANEYDAFGDGLTKIPTTSEAAVSDGLPGVGVADPALLITALDKGTQMAGIKIHFINDVESGLEAMEADGTTPPEIKVDFRTHEDGTRQLIVTANLSDGYVDAKLLADALNANSIFRSMFRADAPEMVPGDDVEYGTVLFNTDVTKPQGQTVGGYRIESDPIGTIREGTSSGVGMTGQSDANERLIIESEELGSNSHVAVNVIRGFLNTVDDFGMSSGYATGSDMMATINGLRATTNGNQISINSPDLSMSMSVANGVGSHGFTITGGGALFQLGPDVVSQQQMRIGIGSMLTSALGGADGSLFMLRSGEAASLMSSDEGRKLADRIVNQAISSVAETRGRLGAIQRGSLEPNILALQDSMVALTEANAMITNADFAVESSNLTRLQLLIQAGAQTLGIANQMPQYAASLIR